MKHIMDLVSELQEKIKWINSYNAAYGITTQEYIINNFDLEDPGDIPLPKADLIVPDDAYDNIKENLLKELKEFINYVESFDSKLDKINKKEGGEHMEWRDIVFELLNDEMINSCGCDGLWDAYKVLNGLLGMSEIMFTSNRFNDDFILEAINASITARNRYCSLNGAKELNYVSLKDGEFIWNKD